MAKGRMLNKKISNSKRVNDLPAEAALLYTWLIPHLDCHGVFYGSGQMVKSLVFPRRNCSIKQVENWLRAMETSKNDDGVTLIKRFRVNGDLFLWMAGFIGEQPGLRTERESSDFPQPPQQEETRLNQEENANILPEKCGKNAGVMPEKCGEMSAEVEVEEKVNRSISEVEGEGVAGKNPATSAATSLKEIFYSFQNDGYQDIKNFDNQFKKFCEYWLDGKHKLQNKKLACHNWLDKAREYQQKNGGNNHAVNQTNNIGQSKTLTERLEKSWGSSSG